MNFEWDEDKNEANIAKHGISFDDPTGIFNGDILRREDNRRDYGETRFTAIGVTAGTELFVVYTMRREVVRIISARKARRDERRTYRQAQAE